MPFKHWKILAIIFISLFILQTFFVILIYKVGQNTLMREDECRKNICDGNFDSYYYNLKEDVCYCFKDKLILKVIKMGDI